MPKKLIVEFEHFNLQVDDNKYDILIPVFLKENYIEVYDHGHIGATSIDYFKLYQVANFLAMSVYGKDKIIFIPSKKQFSIKDGQSEENYQCLDIVFVQSTAGFKVSKWKTVKKIIKYKRGNKIKHSVRDCDYWHKIFDEDKDLRYSYKEFLIKYNFNTMFLVGNAVNFGLLGSCFLNGFGCVSYKYWHSHLDGLIIGHRTIDSIRNFKKDELADI